MHGIVRGPDGKFRSSERGDFDRLEQIAAGWGASIPAADLGTETFVNDDGENTILVDFTDILHSDEVFELWFLQVRAALFSNESENAEDLEAIAHVAIADDIGVGTQFARDPPSFGAATPDAEVGIIDYQAVREDSDTTWFGVAILHADSGIDDTTNGVGQSVTSTTVTQWWPVAHLGATFDEDDELTAPWRIQHRDAATASNLSVGITAHGAVRETH